jgi:hypothetical protein
MSNHNRFVRRTKDKLGRAGFSTLIGAIDLSFNEVKGKNRKRWSRHLHGVVPESVAEAKLKALKQQFPKSADVHKPVHVAPWDGDPKAMDKYGRGGGLLDGRLIREFPLPIR